MPNWCTTSYAITGEESTIKEIYNMMHSLETMKEPLVENGFGPNWLGCLVKKLEGDPSSVYCRGSWYNLNIVDDNVLRFETEHAWSRPEEVIDELLASKYEDISIYFMEEELGMDIFQTNDEYGEYFKETVIIDSENEGINYYTPDEALEELSKLIGKKLKCWQQAETEIAKYNSVQDTMEDGNHVWIHKADIY